MGMNRVSIGRAKKILRIPDPVATFNIYPEWKDKLYFQCQVFRTQAQLNRYIGHRYGRRHNISAKTEVFKPRKPALRIATTSRCIGILYFSLFTCTDNTVAHEVHHAVTWWAKQMRLRPETAMKSGHATHERIAEAAGCMVSGFWKEFCAAGFKRTECWQ